MVRNWGEAARPIQPFSWDQLTLAPAVRALLQEDFECFFGDEDWYKAMRIPHRRGYLLHGRSETANSCLQRSVSERSGKRAARPGCNAGRQPLSLVSSLRSWPNLDSQLRQRLTTFSYRPFIPLSLFQDREISASRLFFSQEAFASKALLEAAVLLGTVMRVRLPSVCKAFSRTLIAASIGAVYAGEQIGRGMLSVRKTPVLRPRLRENVLDRHILGSWRVNRVLGARSTL